jgi:predicted transcriptional regulator
MSNETKKQVTSRRETGTRPQVNKEADLHAILLSIHPRFAQAILSGEKTVEFRRTGFRRTVSSVIVYETAPTSRIVGSFVLDEHVKASPSELWAKFSEESGLTKREFFDYFAGCAAGLALRVGRVIRFSSPVELAAIGKITPPQSFRYLTPPQLDSIAAAAERADFSDVSRSQAAR